MVIYTAAYWATTNPILAFGQTGFDSTNNIKKLGNGETRWLDLVPETSGGNTTSQYTIYNNGNEYIRVGVRNNMFVIDKTITSNGFNGIEGIDWENIGGAN